MNTMALVGYLQSFARLPFASVYMDKDSHALYVFVRVNSPSESKPIYAAAQASAHQITKYLDRRIVLRTIFPPRGYTYFTIHDGKAVRTDFKDSGLTRERLKRAGRFNPEFCHNRVELKCFLNSLENRPL